MSVNRDELNKALEVLRKKDPQNATLQKFDEYMRSFSGNKDTTPYGSVKLWDNWVNGTSSATEEKRLMSSSGKKMVQNLDGSWQSAGYDKAIANQKAAHDAVTQGLADPSTDPVSMDIYNAAQKKLKEDQAKLTAKKNQQTGTKQLTADEAKKAYVGLSPQDQNMNWYDRVNSAAQRVGDQVWKTVFGKDFVASNDAWQRQLAQDELKKNPNDKIAQHTLTALDASKRPD
jgi:hypothetical protein